MTRRRSRAPGACRDVPAAAGRRARRRSVPAAAGAALLLALSLGACLPLAGPAADAPPAGAPAAAATVAATTAPAPAPEQAQRPPAPAANAAAPGPSAALAAPKPPTAPQTPGRAAPEETDPGRVLGLDATGVAELLGAPGIVRREGDARVWQYRQAACVVDLFLYPGAGDRSLSVIHYEVRGGPEGLPIRTEARRGECFSRFVRRRDTA